MESLAPDLQQMRRTPLAPEHVAALREVGTEVTFAAGETMGELGAPQDRFLYLLEGELELVDSFTGDRLVPSTLGPSQFAGDIGFLAGTGFGTPIRAVSAGRALAVPREAMLRLMAKVPEMSDIVITVFAARRRRMIEDSSTGLTFLGAENDRNLRRCAAFANRNRIPFRSVALSTPEAVALAERCGVAPDQPAVLFGRDRIVEDPSPARLAQLLGLGLEPGACGVVDVLIVGGGPAGVAAAVYAGAEGLSALVVEELAVGGQAGTSSRIENYMGFPTGISGGDLVWRGEVQAMKFGTRFAMPNRVVRLERADSGFVAELDDGSCVRARGVLVATGVQYRKPALEGLADFEGAGVYYAATDMEARYCRDTPVAVVGGGNSAGQAAMYLSRSASRVDVLVRGTGLASSMSDYLEGRLSADPAITVHLRTQVVRLDGRERLESITVRDGDGAEREIACGGLFLMVGAAPNTGWLEGLAQLDPKGFVLTGPAAGQDSPYATSCPGLYAVGDVRAGSVKRVAAAVGEGSVVVSDLWQYLNPRG